jgi:hypothetical protein
MVGFFPFEGFINCLEFGAEDCIPRIRELSFVCNFLDIYQLGTNFSFRPYGRNRERSCIDLDKHRVRDNL